MNLCRLSIMFVVLFSSAVIIGCGGGGGDSGDAVAPGAMTTFVATELSGTVALGWTLPTDPDLLDIVIRRSSLSYPTSPSEGDWVYTGHGTTAIDDWFYLAVGTTYYYSAFCYDRSMNWSLGGQTQITLGGGAPPPSSFSAMAVVDPTQVQLVWGDPIPSAGMSIIIRRNTGSYPVSPFDGLPIYNAPVTAGTSFLDTGLTPGVIYYYTIFAFDGSQYSEGLVADTNFTTPTLVSGNSTTGGDGDSRWPDCSGSGNYAVYDTIANNLAPLDGPAIRDVVLTNILTGQSELISTPQCLICTADNHSSEPSITRDGRYVVFSSIATNMLALATFAGSHIYRVDRAVTDNFNKINFVDGGISLFGRWEANDNCYRPDISDDGQYIVFESRASNLITTDDAQHWPLLDGNGYSDVWITKYGTGYCERVSTWAAWSTTDVDTDESISGNSYNARISGDGSTVVFESDAWDIDTWSMPSPFTHVYYRTNAWNQHGGCDWLSRPCSIAENGYPDGHSRNPSINIDGSYIVYDSEATNLANDWEAASPNNPVPGSRHVYLLEKSTWTVTQIDKLGGVYQPNGNAWCPNISRDGRLISFYSDSTDLTGDAGNPAGIVDIFIYDRDTSSFTRVSKLMTGIGANGAPVAFTRYDGTGFFGTNPSQPYYRAPISDDGNYVVYDSTATNLGAPTAFDHIYRFER